MADSMPVDGHCDRRFAGVSDAFAENFHTRGEVGADNPAKYRPIMAGDHMREKLERRTDG